MDIELDIAADIAMLLGQKDLEIARLTVRVRQLEENLDALAPSPQADVHVVHPS